MSMTFTGFLVVAFLHSYEGMGTVSIFIDGNKTGAVTLDGRWAQRTSQTDYVAILLAHLRNVKELGAVHHPMVHEVQLQVPSLEEQQNCRSPVLAMGLLESSSSLRYLPAEV